MGWLSKVGDFIKNNASDLAHGALDVLGMVPVVGFVADLANAGLYLAEGNYVDAAMSAFAAIPGIGDAAALAKGVKNGVKAAKTVKKVDATLGIAGKAKTGAKTVKGPKGAADLGHNKGKSKPKIVNGYEAKVNPGQQNKHIPGTNEHKIAMENGQVKSTMRGDANDIQKLLDEHAGSGTMIGNNKERVDFGEVIGKHVDPESLVESNTTMGIIHYGKKGAHIVPARPK